MTVVFEALNALYGDCLLLRYPGPDGKFGGYIGDPIPLRLEHGRYVLDAFPGSK